jgi:hypothetical protein
VEKAGDVARERAVRGVTGTSRLRVLAVFRLMTSLNRVGCSNGKSARFAPLKIRSMRAAARHLSSNKKTAGKRSPGDNAKVRLTYPCQASTLGLRLASRRAPWR